MGEHVRVAALPGLFVLFPAWLQHYTAAHTTGRPRLSVAFCADMGSQECRQPCPIRVCHQGTRAGLVWNHVHLRRRAARTRTSLVLASLGRAVAS
jgi:hypothetical protein